MNKDKEKLIEDLTSKLNNSLNQVINKQIYYDDY